MTVLSELSKIAYIGSSSQTLYPIPFEYINTDDIKVSIYTSNNEFVEDWTYSTQYVIEGGNVKVLSGYNIDNTKKLLVLRRVDLVQDNKYREGGDFPAKSTETSFDKLTMITQQLQETLDRCVKVEVLDIQSPEELLQTVYDKLDSATEIAGDAISAANQAQTAADNATAAVNSAEQTLVQTQAYVDSAKVEINNTKNTAINTINSTVSTAKGDITNTANNATSNITSTVAQAKTDINAAIDEATTNISDTSTAAINTINTAVSNAESNISTIVSDAEGSITNIAVTEANKAIANAAAEATATAKANVDAYVDGTIKPSLQTYVDQAQADANSAATSMEQAALSATSASNYASNASADANNAAESAGLAANSAIWAEGTDSEVQALGGVHSSKGWSEAAQAVVDSKQDIANLSQTLDDSTTNYPSNAAVKTAIDGKQDIATAVNYTNITNCITEIPQDIKLELVDGTLTLKAGSKVYVPNGFEADGTTPKFDVVEIESDVTRSAFGTISGNWFTTLRLHDDGHFSLGVADRSKSVSGGSSVTPPTDGLWYDTDTNKMRGYSVGAEVLTYATSLPFAISTFSSGTLSSIDQVFNDFGYIGSTVFALPGVKGLIPNGRNADGSLKNIEFTINSVTLRNFQTTAYATNGMLGFSPFNSPVIGVSFAVYYDGEQNLVFENNTKWNRCIVGTASIEKGVITSLTPKTAFHAVDRNDSSWLSGLGMPSSRYIDLTLGASGATYTAPANGWFTIDKGALDSQFINMQNNTNLYGVNSVNGAGGSIRLLLPVLKGDKCYVSYSASGTLYGFRFIYAEGEGEANV